MDKRREKFEIKPLERQHIHLLRKARNDWNVRQHFGNAKMINEIAQEAWFEAMSKDWTKQCFVIEKEGEFVGSVWFDEWDITNRSCRAGIFVIPKFQRRGIGTKAFGQFIEYLTNELNTHRIWLLVLTNNSKAVSLYKKLGFKEEGTQREAVYRNGKYSNYLMMSILSAEKNE